MAVLDLAHLTWEEVRDLDRTKTVAIVPVGAVEAHGPHLPLATDVIIAEAMARAAAGRLAARGHEAVLLPAIAYTAAEFAAGFPGTVSLQPATVTALLVDLARSLARHGLSLLAVANAHLDPAHLGAIEAAVTQIRRADGARIVFPDVTKQPWAVRLTEEFRSGACGRGRPHDRGLGCDPRRSGARGARAVTLAGRGAVVTGGSRGIGLAVARALAEAGAAVVVAARGPDGLEAAARALCAAGRRAWAVPCDVADPEGVRTLAREAETRLGHVDILVNNAGISHSASVQKTTLEDWQRILTVNATGPFLCIQAFLPGMLARGWGRVVSIASVAGLGGGKYITAYSASKHAVVGLTRSVAAEVAGTGVTVNAVCPGYVDTDMTRQSVGRIAAKTGMSLADALRAALDTTGQRRLIPPDEVASAVLTLCHGAGSETNGEAVVIAEAGSRR